VKVTTVFSGKDESVREGEWYGWECEWAHEVEEGREDRLPKENMRGTGVGQDGRGGNRTKGGRGGGVLVRFVIVGIV
jgi:hypothetical protein